jgi:hypothetical protein
MPPKAKTTRRSPAATPTLADPRHAGHVPSRHYDPTRTEHHHRKRNDFVPQPVAHDAPVTIIPVQLPGGVTGRITRHLTVATDGTPSQLTVWSKDAAIGTLKLALAHARAGGAPYGFAMDGGRFLAGWEPASGAIKVDGGRLDAPLGWRQGSYVTNGANSAPSRHGLGHLPVMGEGNEYGGRRYVEQAVRLMAEGAPDRAGLLRDLMNDLRRELPPPADLRRRMAWGGDGEELNVDRALRGDWETAYRRSVRSVRASSPTISLIVQPGGCYACDQIRCNYTPEEHLMWRAAAALAAAAVMEERGWRVAVYLGALLSNTNVHPAARREVAYPAPFPEFSSVASLAIDGALIEWKKPHEPVNLSMLAALCKQAVASQVSDLIGGTFAQGARDSGGYVFHPVRWEGGSLLRAAAPGAHVVPVAHDRTQALRVARELVLQAAYSHLIGAKAKAEAR